MIVGAVLRSCRVGRDACGDAVWEDKAGWVRGWGWGCRYQSKSQTRPPIHAHTRPHQVSYFFGGRVGRNRGYVVGATPRAPRAPQHREASCWPGRDEEPCTALSALLPPDKNPSVIVGALVAGPDDNDDYIDSRLALGARVGVHYNAALLGALAGLVHGDVQQSRCQGSKGFLSELLPDQLLGV